MHRVISVVGVKGGSGKTHLSHCLARGLGLAGCAAMHVTTDQRYVLSNNTAKRGYIAADGRDEKKIADLLNKNEKIGQAQDVFTVIDGGATRFGSSDDSLMTFSDLVLIPMMFDYENFRLLQETLPNISQESLSKLWIIPNNLANNRVHAEADLRKFMDHLLGVPTGIFFPAIRPIREVLQDPWTNSLDAKVNEISKLLAQFVLSKFELADPPKHNDWWAIMDRYQQMEQAALAQVKS